MLVSGIETCKQEPQVGIQCLRTVGVTEISVEYFLVRAQ